MFKALFYELDVCLGRGDSALRLFLKSMQDINLVSQPHRIDRSKRIAAIIGHDFQYTRSQTPQRFRVHVFVAGLRLVECEADLISDCRTENS